MTHDILPHYLVGSLSKHQSSIVPSILNNAIICQEPMLLFQPLQIDVDYINNKTTSVTRCEINHHMKTSNHWSWILRAYIQLEEENVLPT